MTKVATRGLLVALAVLVAVVLVGPLVIIVLLSFNDAPFLTFPPDDWSLRWYRSLADDPVWRDSAATSLRIGVLVAVLSSVLGTLGALALVRGRLPLKAAVSGLVLAPMMIPVVVVAISVYRVFLDLGLTQTTLGFVLVHTCLAVPYVTVNVAAALSGFDHRLELAAQSLGANRWQAFWRVTFPLIAPGVLTGALFAFVTSWDEVVVGIFLSGPEMTTLPVQMWQGVKVTIDPTIAAASTALLALTALAFAAYGIANALRRPLRTLIRR